MVVNNSYGDEMELYTTVGVRAPVVSLNQSIGARGDKALRRAEAASHGAAPCECRAVKIGLSAS